MTNVLETGFDFMESDNPNGSPKVKGYNIINGELKSSSGGETFESLKTRRPAPLLPLPCPRPGPCLLP